MKTLTDLLRSYYTPSVYKKGEDYFYQQRVLECRRDSDHDQNLDWVISLVEGNELYTAVFPLPSGKITERSLIAARCNCPHFASNHTECKHIVASLLHFTDKENTSPSKKSTKEMETFHNESNIVGRNLLRLYQAIELEVEQKNDVVLKPQIYNVSGEYPQIAFTVGVEKMYVVKRLDQFLEKVEEEEDGTYGKNFSFNHSIIHFEPFSQKLIQILQGQNNHRDYFSFHHPPQFSDNNRAMLMDGNSFRLFFRHMLGQKLKIEDWKEKEVLFQDGTPNILLYLTKVENGATVRVESDTNLYFYGNATELYALTNSYFFRCPPAYSQKIHELTYFLDADIFVAENDLPTLCCVVLRQVQDYITVIDPDLICESFLPDHCTPCFYFDQDEEYGLVARLKFRYDDMEIGEKPTEKQLSQIRRNTTEEERAKRYLKNYFDYFPQKRLYLLNIEEEQFLTTTMREFRAHGEVLLSQSLRNRFVDTKTKPTMGISVSDGVLDLNMDTGEFPPEELEALYGSFLKKKKYHKLKDGRILFLEESGFEKMAEIAHMLQLSSKDLKKKNISLPAYRGLYLDSVLESQDVVETSRSQTFRRMMKDFKGVADSDYQPSSSLLATLRPYQVLGFQWMKTLEQYGFCGILADEMGLGKTVQVITYLLSVVEGQAEGSQLAPSLIVCPASLLLNWGDEFQKFAPSLNVMLILGNAKERQAQLESEEGKTMDVWVTSYDLIKRDKDYYEKKSFHCCVLDEAQHIKNQSTLISKTVKNIVSKQRFVLTGTPIENKLSELWNLFDFLMPGYLFTHHAFVTKLEKPIVQSGEALAGQQLRLLVQPFIMRRLKKDVLKDLPEKMEHLQKIHLSEEERKLYLATVHRVKAEANGTENRLQILALLTHLRQLCCDPNLCFENYEGESSKLSACLELCRSLVDNGHKILLFSQFTSMLDRIRDGLVEERITNLTIEGSTPKEKRAKYVKDFQKGLADVFLISLKAGGTGLNLTNADVVIHYDPWWNMAAQNQATDRAHRIGQEQHVQVYKLIAQGTIEEKILELQEKKAGLMDCIMSEATDTTLSRDDIFALLDE